MPNCALAYMVIHVIKSGVCHMKRALIVQDLCVNCQPCPVEQECTGGAIIRELPEDKPWIDFYRCTGCLKCAPRCPQNAVEDIAQPCDAQRKMGW